MSKNKSQKSNQSIEYFIYPNPSYLHGGINNKIIQIVDTLNEHDYPSKKVTAESGIMGLINISKKLFMTNADIVIFRNTFFMPLLIPNIILLRLKRKYVILDLPTPITNVLYEFKMRQNLGFFQKHSRMAIVIFFYPLMFLPFNKILQYATESTYFSLCTKQKTMKVANGINVSSFPIINNNDADKWEGKSLTIIGVANMSIWHGFDRIIKAIADYTQNTKNFLPVHFIVVGEGQAKNKWEELSQQLGVSEFVTFKGYQRGKQLDELFDQADIAVSGIARFRKKLFEGSALKSREYTARGIPFIAAGSDIDFEPNPSFIYKIEDNENEVSIGDIIEWYRTLTSTKDLRNQIRAYALRKIDYSVKISDFIPIN